MCECVYKVEVGGGWLLVNASYCLNITPKIGDEQAQCVRLGLSLLVHTKTTYNQVD